MNNNELQQILLAYQTTALISQFKTGFLARISHELRSPLSSLISLHQLILNDLCDNPEEEREFINQAYQSALKLMQLIDNIIDVSKIEYGSIETEITEVQVSQIWEKVYHLTHLQATNHNISLNIIFLEEDINVLADEKIITQVLITLIDTGISLMEKGNIRVTNKTISSELLQINLDFFCNPSQWSESVNLLEELPEQITKESVRDFSKKLEFSPGMKLMLCQNLIETMGGKISLISPENNITRIQILLNLNHE